MAEFKKIADEHHVDTGQTFFFPDNIHTMFHNKNDTVILNIKTNKFWFAKGYRFFAAFKQKPDILLSKDNKIYRLKNQHLVQDVPLTALIHEYTTSIDNYKLSTHQIDVVALNARDRTHVLLLNLNNKKISKVQIIQQTKQINGKYIPRQYKYFYKAKMGYSFKDFNQKLFIFHQSIDNITVYHHVTIFDVNGQKEASYKIKGWENKYLPFLFDDGVAVLSRQDNYICLYKQNEKNTLKKLLKCSKDIENAQFNKKGELLFYRNFGSVSDEVNKQQNLMLKNISANLVEGTAYRQYNYSPYSDQLNITETQKTSQRNFYLFVNNIPSFDYDSYFKAQNLNIKLGIHQQIFIGKNVSVLSKDGVKISGYWFSVNHDRERRVKPKGIIIYYHGGPYRSASEIAPRHSVEFIKMGFDVISVNYRGSVGSGRALIEAGYGLRHNQMAQDGLDLADLLLNGDYNKFNIPIYSIGVSYGGFITIKLSKKNSNRISGVALIASACNQHHLNYVDGKYSPKAVMAKKIAPAKYKYRYLLHGDYLGVANSLERIKQLSECSTPISSNIQTVIIHGKLDNTVPYAFARQFIKQQNKKSTLTIIYPASRHSVPNNEQLASLTTRIIKHWKMKNENYGRKTDNNNTLFK